MKMENLYLLVGPSGCGKTTLAVNLSRHYGMVPVVSYTTRPKREGEAEGIDHYFVSDEEFDSHGEMVAFTNFNGHRYGATQEIVDRSNVYVIDPAGVEYLKSHINGDRKIVTIGFLTSPEVCAQHMRGRGDGKDKIEERLEHDSKAFADLPSYCDLMVDGSLNARVLAEQVYALLQNYEPHGVSYDKLLGMFSDYVSNDYVGAEPDYVREMLDNVGCDEDVRRQIGLDWMDGE